MSEVNYMNIHEFLEEGYLQEANRRFFHPLGLALCVDIDEDGSVKLGGIWDYRNDKEGIYYSPAITKLDKFKSRAARFDELFQEKLALRQELLGFGIQEPSL